MAEFKETIATIDLKIILCFSEGTSRRIVVVNMDGQYAPTGSCLERQGRTQFPSANLVTC